MQSLFTGNIYLGGNPFDGKQAWLVAKAFEMVARAVKLLKLYYRDLPVQSELKPCLPSPSYHRIEPPHSLVFKSHMLFEGKVDNRRPLFRAEYNNLSMFVKNMVKAACC